MIADSMRRRWFAVVPLVTVWLLAAGAGVASELTCVHGDTLRIPGEGRLTGLTWAGEDTLATLDVTLDEMSLSGAQEVMLVLRNGAGEILMEMDFSGVLDRTLAWDGEYLWSCGDAADGSSILYKIQPDTLVVEEAFTAPGHRPSSLAYDGRYLWLTDRDSGRIERFDPEVGEFTRTVAAPAFSPWGMAWDGRHMWMTDVGTGRLYRLAGSRMGRTGTVAVEDFLFRGDNVLLWHDGQDLRYLTGDDRQAVRLVFD